MRLILSLISVGLLLCGCGGGGGDSSGGQQPSPSISTLTPASATAGSVALTLTVNGANFVSASVVKWNGAALPTSYTSAAQLVAQVPASDIAAAGTAQVTVANPTSEGGASAAASFTIAAVQDGAPLITSLAPAIAAAGGAALTLAVSGGNFVASSVVQWNGAALPTSYVSAALLKAQVPASDIAAAGTAAVTVLNPAANGGLSVAVSFSIGAQGAGPQLVQWTTYSTSGNATEGNSTLQFDSATKAGDTIWVAVTVSDYAGVHSIGVTDTQGNSYTLLDQENDGPPGTQTVAHFYASSIAGDTASPDTVTINWTQDNYKGILIAELSGTTQTTAVGHSGNIQDGLGVAANAVTSGPINVSGAETPALLVALSMDTTGGASDTGGSGSAGPTAGTGMTPVTTLWNYGANLATFVTASVTSGESISATFTPLDTDSYVTVAAVFH